MTLHAPSCRHAVFFYREQAAVREAVVPHIASALRHGNPALVIARPALIREFIVELHREHVDGVPFGRQRGTLVTLDAEETLARLSADGSPVEELFHAVVTPVVRRLSEGGAAVTAYGEMVGILCERGRYADAVRLEGMWNTMLRGTGTALFCGYSHELFSRPGAEGFLEQVRAAHTESRELDARATCAAEG